MAIKTSPHSEAWLHKSLEPLIFVAYYCGVLPVWCGKKKVHRAWSTLSWMGSFLVLAILISSVLFECYQMTIQFSIEATLFAVVKIMMWLQPSFVAAVIQLQFISSASKLRNFLGDWRQLEESLLVAYVECNIRKIRLLYYIPYLIFGLVTLAAVPGLIVMEYDQIHLISYYETFQGPSTLPIAVTIHGIFTFFHMVVTTTAQMMFALFYYHASLAVRVLTHRIEISTDRYSEKRLFQVWKDYQNISKCVDRANQLFGFITVALHCFFIFTLCVLTYNLFYGISINDTSGRYIYIGLISTIAYRLVVDVILASKLQQAATSMRAQLSELQRRRWLVMSAEERETTGYIGKFFHENRLNASPWSLYTIQPSLLLFILNLVVTYVAILMQS